ncbi:hypothetical protein SHIRM173S_09409 [Streptomyces hirsutus]
MQGTFEGAALLGEIAAPDATRRDQPAVDLGQAFLVITVVLERAAPGAYEDDRAVRPAR